MKPVTKMIWLIALIIIIAGLCFVLLDDEDTKDSPLQQLQSSEPIKK